MSMKPCEATNSEDIDPANNSFNNNGDLGIQQIDFEELQVLKLIGKGSFGNVHHAHWNGILVAVKIADTDNEILALENEIAQLSRLRHCNVINIYGVSLFKNTKYLVMEYADGGDLYYFLHHGQKSSDSKYTFVNSMNWLVQCAKAVHYLHSIKPKAIVHRDLKPLNMLLTNQRRILKLCDFGTARTKAPQMTDNKGSITWMAPEVMLGGDYDEKCDVYSWGIILWEILTRRIPFNELGSQPRIIYQVVNGKRPPPISGCPEVLENLMNRCWDKVRSKRPSMEEVLRVVTPIYRLVNGGDDAVPCPSTPRTESDSSVTYEDVSQFRTSEDASEFSDNVIERDADTPLVTDYNSDMDLTDLPVNSSDFVVVPRAVSCDVTTSIVVSASNLASPWGSARTEAESLPHTNMPDDGPIGTCIDIPHVPRSVLNQSDDHIDPQVMQPLNILIPPPGSTQDPCLDASSNLYLPTRPSELAPPLQPRVLRSPSSPYDPFPNCNQDTHDSHCFMAFPHPYHPERGYNCRELPRVPPRRKSTAIFGVDASPSYSNWTSGSPSRVEYDLHRRTFDSMRGPHRHPVETPGMESFTQNDIWQALDDDLKPAIPLPACSKSQHIYDTHKSISNELLQVEKNIYHLRVDREKLQGEFRKKDSAYKRDVALADDLIWRRKLANQTIEKENALIRQELERRRQSHQASGFNEPNRTGNLHSDQHPTYAESQNVRRNSPNAKAHLFPGASQGPTGESPRSQSAQELRQYCGPRRFSHQSPTGSPPPPP